MTNSSAPLLLNGDPLTLAQLEAVAAATLEVAIAPGSTNRMLASRAVVDRAAAGDVRPVRRAASVGRPLDGLMR